MPAQVFGPLPIDLSATPADCTFSEGGWAVGWGDEGWGDGNQEAGLCLVRALAWRENVVRLFFSQDVLFRNLLERGDGADIERYSVAVVAGTVGIDGLEVRPVLPLLANPVLGRPKEVDLWVDRPFSPWPARYIVEVNGILGTDCQELAVREVEFFGLFKGLPSPLPELAPTSRDIANPQTGDALFDPLPEASTLPDDFFATYRYDETGDVATDEGLASYKKRVFRRLLTKKNRFAHLPGYGTLIPDSVKRLARPALRQSLAADAEDQIRQEPETVAVKVVVEMTTQGVAFYRIRVKTNIGKAANMAVPIAFSPTEETNG